MSVLVLRMLTPSNVLPLFDITEHKAVYSLQFLFMYIMFRIFLSIGKWILDVMENVESALLMNKFTLMN